MFALLHKVLYMGITAKFVWMSIRNVQLRQYGLTYTRKAIAIESILAYTHIATVSVVAKSILIAVVIG